MSEYYYPYWLNCDSIADDCDDCYKLACEDRVKATGIWTTKKGSAIKLKDMSDTHLNNAYNMFKYEVLKGEIDRRKAK